MINLECLKVRKTYLGEDHLGNFYLITLPNNIDHKILYPILYLVYILSILLLNILYIIYIDTLDSMNNLALLLRIQYKYEKAEELYLGII